MFEKLGTCGFVYLIREIGNLMDEMDVRFCSDHCQRQLCTSQKDHIRVIGY